MSCYSSNRHNNSREIILLSPLPPPLGGVASWTKSILEIKGKSFISVDHIDTASKDILPSASRKNPLIIFKRSTTFLLISLKVIKKKFKNSKRKILHLCTSGKLGFLKDILILILAKSLNMKTIIHLHYGDFQKDYEESNFLKKISGLAFSLSDRIITIDSNTFSYINKNFKNKSALINNGFNLNYKFKSSFTFNKVIYVGRIEKAKGSHELIETYIQYNEKNYIGELTLIGECFDSFLLRKIKHSTNINWLGKKNREYVIESLSESSCLILPSYSEGMPFVVIEAMSLGLPVISSKVGGLVDLLGKDYPFPIVKHENARVKALNAFKKI